MIAEQLESNSHEFLSLDEFTQMCCHLTIIPLTFNDILNSLKTEVIGKHRSNLSAKSCHRTPKR